MPGRKAAVLGGGNGGFAAAVDLARRGFSVSLYNRSADTIARIRETGAIQYEGVLGSGAAEVKATTDIGDAVADAELRHPPMQGMPPRWHPTCGQEHRSS
jgi:opine dehydrogenase